MSKERNPFIVTGKIPAEYFCDRVSESTRLIKSITNGNNILIISQRRMGKTGLVQFCYDNSKIANTYYTFFIDILHTSSLKELAFILGKEIYSSLASKSTKKRNLFLQTLKSISGTFGFDPILNIPTFSLELGAIEQPELTLQEIFEYLSKADKPCIVAIDEFQQIAKYPEQNIEALLRTHIQKISNANFIFAGSERQILQNMFASTARPFYNSADLLELNAIHPDEYIPFIIQQFENNNKTIPADTAMRLYNLFNGHTFYMQKTLNEAFADTNRGGTCTIEIIRNSIDALLLSYAPIFKEILSNIPEKQKDLLYAIAQEGDCQRITSADFIKKHHLASASSVQAAARVLLDREIITEINKVYSVNDKLFALWIREIYGKGYTL